MRCPAARLAIALFLSVLASMHTVPAALATFTSNPTHPTSSVSSATLAAPTSLSTSCFLLTPTHIRLNWTVTSSTWADGYRLFRGTAHNGPYTDLGAVTPSGQAVTTVDNTRPSAGTTYYYVLQSTKQLWRSVNSNEAQTPGICIL
jgi:hypothetical protein